ncbi:uncharacterized protein LOC112464773 [Temnothorax curvispinosus]|uniref:Uncharacterized protein LOC112464773 n=1 Tax=Temnothorax curvispinosus TaxID=300111 RepID=A0A6J1R4D5_9HYME|nr:uncharacterized protein LOC112464773 [Temnothorax curvispinosus]
MRPTFIVRYPTVAQLVQDFEEAYLQVIQDATDEDFAIEDAIRDEFDKMRFAVIGRYESFVPARGTDASLRGAPPAHHSAIKLPKIALPQFTGDFALWPSFIALFDSAIHENDGVSAIEKFQYLLASLSGEAFGVVKNLPLTAENYAIAYDALRERYQNKRKLATQYWRSFVHAKSLVTDSAESLRVLLDVFTENTRALSMLGYFVEAWDFMLLNHLLEKLTPTLREKFEATHVSVEPPRYDQLTKFLTGYCTVLASVSDSSAGSNKSKSQPSKKSTTSLVAQTAACPKCKAQHYLGKCPGFLQLSVRERHSFVREQGLCLNCLRTGHNLKACHTSWTCRTCHAKHHSLLHFERANPTSLATTPVVTPVANSPAAPVDTGDKPIVSMASVSNRVILLSTVPAEALDVHSNAFPVRMLLDSASQANFITESCLRRGGFSRTRHRTTVLGVNKTKATTRGFTSFVIRVPNRFDTRFPVEATVLPRITSPLPNNCVASKSWDHLRGLSLADPKYYLPVSIDVLLGAELFVSVLRDNRRTGNHGEPDAFKTAFGWVLKGAIDAAVGQF